MNATIAKPTAPMKTTKSPTAPKTGLALEIEEFAQAVGTLRTEAVSQQKRIDAAADAESRHAATMKQVEAEELDFATGSKDLATIAAEKELLAFQIGKRGTEILSQFSQTASRALELKTKLLGWVDRAEAATVSGIQAQCGTWLATLGGQGTIPAAPLPLAVIAAASPEIGKMEAMRRRLEGHRIDQPAEAFISLAGEAVALLAKFACEETRTPAYGGIQSNHLVNVSGWAGSEQRRELIAQFGSLAEGRQFLDSLRASSGYLGLFDIVVSESTTPQFAHTFSNSYYEGDHRALADIGSRHTDGGCAITLSSIAAWTAAA